MSELLETFFRFLEKTKKTLHQTGSEVKNKPCDIHLAPLFDALVVLAIFNLLVLADLQHRIRSQASFETGFPSSKQAFPRHSQNMEPACSGWPAITWGSS